MLFSPGVDSFISDHILNDNKTPNYGSMIKRVYYDLNTKCSSSEIEKLKSVYSSDHVEIINDLSYLGNFEKKNYSIMNRNLTMICDAAMRFEPDTIVLSGNKDDRIADNTEEFRSLVTTIMSGMFEKNISILSPLKNFEKSKAIYKYIQDVGTDIGIKNLLNKTLSCYCPVNEREFIYYRKDLLSDEFISGDSFKTKECLKCKACFRKYTALVGVNVYVNFDKLILNEYKSDMQNNTIAIDRFITMERYKQFMETVN